MDAQRTPSIANLSYADHAFTGYHFCRGNTSKRASRIGLIEAGRANFMYLNQKITVSQGDVVFIPEKVFCYSEWFGAPDIRVFYLSFNLDGDEGEGSLALQVLPVQGEETRALLRRARLALQGGLEERLEAYSLVYHFLAQYLPLMNGSRRKVDRVVNDAIQYITDHWNKDFSVADVARECSVCESRLYHLFREQLGQTPVAYLNAVKVNYAIQYLENEDCPLSRICQLTNFHSESYFRRVFHSVTGSNPSDFRKNCRLP